MNTEFIINKLKTKFPDIYFSTDNFRDQFVISFEKQYIVEVCDFLKTDPELDFNMCDDVTAIDWAKKSNRFTVVYFLLSLKNKFRLRLKCNVEESDCKIDSVTSVWKSANYYEREVYDMFGIEFINHPDMRRIYMPDDFEYHPLRKEFPVMGVPGSMSLPPKN